MVTFTTTSEDDGLQVVTTDYSSHDPFGQVCQKVHKIVCLLMSRDDEKKILLKSYSCHRNNIYFVSGKINLYFFVMEKLHRTCLCLFIDMMSCVYFVA